MFQVSATSDRLWNYVELVKYLNQNQHSIVNLKIVPEAICLTNVGLYDLLDCFSFEQVNIYTNNPLECHNRYNIVFTKNYHWFDVEPVDSALHSWTGKKLFYCLFGRPTAGRLGLAGYLDYAYPTQSLIHFSADLSDDNLVQFELNKLLNYHPLSIKSTGNLIQRFPLLLSSNNRYTAFDGFDYSDPLTNFYQDILIDIVVESHVAGTTFYATEKTVRSMLLKKPFVVFASADYLDYLHQMGFKTFCEFWDETYDGFETKDRFIKILALLDTLAKKSQTELETMYKEMQSTLDYNYNLLISKKFNTDIRKIV
jgi:hypothetical protein